MSDEPQCLKCGGRGMPDCEGCFGCGLDLSQHPLIAPILAALGSARTRIEQLELAIQRYGDHADQCRYIDCSLNECNCGFDDARFPNLAFARLSKEKP